MVATLEDFHNPELVFRENLRKTIGGFHLFPGFIPVTGSAVQSGKDVAKTYLSGDLLCNGDMIPGHHFHVHAMFFCLGNRGRSILRGGSKSPIRPRYCHVPLGLVRPTPSARYPFSANAVIQPSSVEAVPLLSR